MPGYVVQPIENVVRRVPHGIFAKRTKHERKVILANQTQFFLKLKKPKHFYPP